MTVSEMHIGLTLLLDRVASGRSFDFQPEEKDWFLNRAVEQLVGSRIKALRMSDPAPEDPGSPSLSALDDIRTLITHSSAITSFSNVTGMSGVQSADISSLNADYVISGKAIFGDANSSILRMMPTNKALEYMETDYNVTIARDVPATIVGSHLWLVMRSYVPPPTSLTLLYVSKPAVIRLPSTSVDCNLPSHVHAEVVSLAAANIISTFGGSK